VQCVGDENTQCCMVYERRGEKSEMLAVGRMWKECVWRGGRTWKEVHMKKDQSGIFWIAHLLDNYMSFECASGEWRKDDEREQVDCTCLVVCGIIWGEFKSGIFQIYFQHMECGCMCTKHVRLYEHGVYVDMFYGMYNVWKCVFVHITCMNKDLEYSGPLFVIVSNCLLYRLTCGRYHMTYLCEPVKEEYASFCQWCRNHTPEQRFGH